MARQAPPAASAPLVGMATRTACCHKSAVTTVDWSCDGARLLAGGDSATVRAYETDRLAQRDVLYDRECVAYGGHKAQIEHVVASPKDSHRFATTGYDNVINMYDARRGTGPTRTLPLGKREGVSMAWSDDGKWIVTGDAADAIRIVDVEKGEVVRMAERSAEVNQMRWARQGNLMYLALGDGRVEVVSWPKMKHQRYLLGHRGRCLCIAVDPAGRRFAVSSTDTLVTSWNALTLNCEYVIDRADREVACMDYSFNGSYLATASAGGDIEISLAHNGTRLVTVPTPGPVRDMRWHPQRLLLAYCVMGDRGAPRPPPASRLYPNAPPPPLPQAKTYVYGFPPAASPHQRHRQ
jgi:THO complex subunit 3